MGRSLIKNKVLMAISESTRALRKSVRHSVNVQLIVVRIALVIMRHTHAAPGTHGNCPKNIRDDPSSKRGLKICAERTYWIAVSLGDTEKVRPRIGKNHRSTK